MRHLLALALLAATCQRPTGPAPVPDPVPYPIPDGGDDDDASAPASVCEIAWAVQADAECPPVVGHDEWLRRCAKLPSPTVACVMSVESCASMRACLGDFQ